MKIACTKIVATIGPASNSAEMIDALLVAGVDVFRLNMSHGNHEGHAEVINHIRRSSARHGQPVGILCDLSGPKIRIGPVDPQPVELHAGAEIIVTTEPGVVGTAERVNCNYAGLAKDVKVGQRVLLDDGLLEFEVLEVAAPEVKCRVIRGGMLSSSKGLNLPNTHLNISSLTEKDRTDIEFGLAHDVDFFAVSFVKRAADIREARAFMKSLGGSLPLIAKIEVGEAVENIAEILEIADGAMVARGDLGVEIPIERVPLVQKKVIAVCNRLGKPVITATQMLDSMIRSSRPTRAEVTDVANAILDGTDAVMLSGETASGQYPLEAVQMMARIAETTDEQVDSDKRLEARDERGKVSVPEAISHATAVIARDLGVKHILCLTQGGSTVRRVARYRPTCGILAYCPDPRITQQLCLTWGVVAVTRPDTVDVEAERRRGIEYQILQAARLFTTQGRLATGDRVVVTAGVPLHEPGTTNLLRVIDVE